MERNKASLCITPCPLRMPQDFARKLHRRLRLGLKPYSSQKSNTAKSLQLNNSKLYTFEQARSFFNILFYQAYLSNRQMLLRLHPVAEA